MNRDENMIPACCYSRLSEMDNCCRRDRKTSATWEELTSHTRENAAAYEERVDVMLISPQEEEKKETKR